MDYAEMSNVGNKREVNQDAIYAMSRGEIGLYVVADGMGGYEQGDKASKSIVDRMEGWWNGFSGAKYENDFKKMVHSLQQALEQANRDIFYQYNQGAVCGSTVVVLFCWKELYAILYVGDSRVYRYREHKFRQLTIDEVWENQADLTEEEKKKNWKIYNGKLLNAVGIRDQLQCRVITDQINQEEIFLLCSDGLYKYCAEKQIRKYMRKAQKGGKLHKCCEALMKKTLAGEAKDNISIIIIRF